MDDSTVKFNIGGKLYEVSRTLLESFPETMLFSISSERWTNGRTKAIFIDRNGDRFQCILDYMRDNEVHVPCSVSKDALLKDFKFYGFKLDSNSITTSFAHPSNVADELISWENQRKQSIAELEIVSKCVELEKKYTEFCFTLLRHHLLTKTFHIIFAGADFAKYGGFITHFDDTEFKNSTSPHTNFLINKLLQKCAKKCQISYINACKSGRYQVRFGLLDKKINEDDNDHNQASEENVYVYERIASLFVAEDDDYEESYDRED